MSNTNNEVKSANTQNIDKPVIAIALIFLGALIAYIVGNPEKGASLFVNVRGIINNTVGVGFLWISLLAVIICFYLVVSKYGKIRLGEGKPQYSTFSWCAMMFCSAMGASLQYWSVVEWSYYYSAPPMGFAEAFSPRAAEVSLAYGFFHWGITPWALYALGSVPMAYLYYVRKKPGLKCSNVCIGVIGEKHADGLVGRIIDTVFIFALVAGLATTFGTGAYMVSACVSEVLGIQNSFTLVASLVFAIAILFLASSYVGIDKGLQKVADFNSYYAIGFIAVLAILGPTLFIVNSSTNSIGILANNFIEMSLWTDPISKGGFPEGWTMFYWAFWLGTAPWMWIFTAKVSRGRKIKDLILCMLGAGCFGTLLYFGVISNFAIEAQSAGTFDMVKSISELGPDVAVAKFARFLPGGLFSLVSWTIIAMLFLSTTMDSGAFTLATCTTKGLKVGEEPSRGLRLFWALMLTGLPLGFLMAGAPIEALKASANISGSPILIVFAFAIISMFKWLKEDYGHKTVHEIEKEFATETVAVVKFDEELKVAE